MNYKIAAIGSEDTVFSFYQLGIHTFPQLEGDALLRQVARLIKDGYMLLFISEECLADTPSLLQNYDKETSVAIIPIPGINGGNSIGRQRIADMAEKALGQRIL